MYIEPFIPTPKAFLAKYGEAGMSAAIRFLFAMGILMALMFLAPSIFPGVVGGLVAHAMAVAMVACIVGILASIYFMWCPAHDELVRRKNEPYYQGIRFQWRALADSFFSASLIRATPPPRHFHR